MNKSLFFIGITPPRPIEEEIHRLKLRFYQKYETKGSLRSKAHITLQMPFILASKKEERFLTELNDLIKNKNAFEIQLNGFGKFEPRVIFINVNRNTELESLQKSVEKFMKSYQIFNSTHQNNGFNPHITVAFRDLKKPQFYKLWEVVKEESYSRGFLADGITIFKHNGKNWDVFKELKFEASKSSL